MQISERLALLDVVWNLRDTISQEEVNKIMDELSPPREPFFPDARKPIDKSQKNRL